MAIKKKIVQKGSSRSGSVVKGQVVNVKAGRGTKASVRSTNVSRGQQGARKRAEAMKRRDARKASAIKRRTVQRGRSRSGNVVKGQVVKRSY